MVVEVLAATDPSCCSLEALLVDVDDWAAVVSAVAAVDVVLVDVD